MAKLKSIYVCSECGYETGKWLGKCPDCGAWNTLVEEVREVQTPAKTAAAARIAAAMPATPVPIGEISSASEDRIYTGLSELDRVLGGGIVTGSIVLLGGDPGIGKSTILLQICQTIAEGRTVLYVSGEESNRQTKMRAKRLGVDSENLYVLSETNIDTINETIRQLKPAIAIIDSIQTMNHPALNSSPGTVTQVRECTMELMRVAKAQEVAIFIVGHVNKDGAIAGPKVLEHIVDAVLYFEGERSLSYRILRAVKNRFGSTNEIGVFEMGECGLVEVENPSLMLLSGRPKNVSGTCVACVMEGSRPILAEVQALVTQTGFGNPRRVSTCFDYNRMCLILAVLEKRAGFFFSNMDTYINVVGGLRLMEPSADLSVAIALISSLKDIPVPEKVLAFGELGLAGELRAASNVEQRLKEAARMGFERCIIPHQNAKQLGDLGSYGMEIIPVKNIRQAYEATAG